MPKSPEMEKFLEEMFGRTTAMNNRVCLPKPIGCGKPITGFKDKLSEKEYSISGLCQECQDIVFAPDQN